MNTIFAEKERYGKKKFLLAMTAVLATGTELLKVEPRSKRENNS